MAYSKTRNLSKLLGSGNTGAIPQTSISSEVSFGVNSYNNINTLPLSGNTVGDQAFVDSDNRLYIWNGTGWYNIALINTNPSITGGYSSDYIFETNGTPIEITLIGSDPEGIPLTWSYEVTSGSLTNGGGTTATVEQNNNVFTITPTTTEDYAGEFSITFKASDGVNLATALSNFTLAFRVLDSKYTTLLVKAKATGANATFVDSSINALTVTKTGDVTQGTFSPYSPAGYTLNVAQADTLAFSSGDTTVFGTADFTIEFWVKINTSGNYPSIFYWGSPVASMRFGDSGFGYKLQVGNNLNSFSGIWSVGSYTQLNMTGNTYHIAYVRQSGSVSVYINGIKQLLTNADSGATSYSFPLTNNLTDYIRLANTSFAGEFTDLRITKSAVYTANFTPPTKRLESLVETSFLLNTPYIDQSKLSITAGVPSMISQVSIYDYTSYDSGFHGGSAYFDGTGDYLTVPYTTSLMDWWSTDFTLECWIFPKTLTGAYYVVGGSNIPTLISNGDPTANTNYWSFGPVSDGTVRLFYYNGAVVFPATSTETVNLNQWNHIAVIKDSNGFKYFVNGVGSNYISISGTPQSNAAYPLAIGQVYNTSFNGYVSNVRLVKGTAVYTSDFTPPTAPLTAITSTSLLLNCTNADIIDNSSKNNLQLVGNTSASATQTKYAARSVYFDGTGDYILSPASAIGSGDFTVEAWFYTSNLSTYMCILDTRAGSATGFALYSGATGGVTYANNTAVVIEAGTASANAWNHIALVRSSGTVSLYLNGTSVGSATDTRTFTETIYTIGSADGGAQPFNGYIEDLRISKGLARYTANFTPPTSELLG